MISSWSKIRHILNLDFNDYEIEKKNHPKPSLTSSLFLYAPKLD